LSKDGSLNSGTLASLASVNHVNLVAQQPDGSFEFISDINNVAAIYADNLVFRAKVAAGEVPGVSRFDKFGAGSIGTSLVPISGASTYKTPTSATALEFISTSTNDGVGGSGAREISVIGLDANFLEITQTLTTNGTTPVPLTTDLTRLYRWGVVESGSYANETVGSHVGDMSIQEVGSGPIWDTIQSTPFPSGRSHIGAYSIPTGKTGFLISKRITVDSLKTVNVYFFAREKIDDVTSPYTGIMQLIERDFGLSGTSDVIIAIPKGPFVGPADIGALAQSVVGTAEVSINFNILLLDT